MPKTRAQKEQIVEELSDKLGRMKSAVFTSVSGYTMDDADGLRTKGRESGVELSVTKKNLLMLALKEKGIEASKDEFEGSILTAFGYNDEVAPAKIISEFGKDREDIKVIGGILEGKMVDAESIGKLAKLPSKEELLAKLVGSINAPRSGFVNALAGNLRNIVYVLNSIKESKA